MEKECRSGRKQPREPRQQPFNDDASMHLRVKSMSETAKRATETMIHLNGLLKTPLSDCLEYNFWLCHQNLTKSKEPGR